MEGLIILIFLFSFFVATFFVGTTVERAHYKSIDSQETQLSIMPVITSDNIDEEDHIVDARLVYGSVVISLDYFKRFLAWLKKFFGGSVLPYESLLDRGRREAILRMKKKALDAGYNMILNMRFETSSVWRVPAKGNIGCFEVMAYGTAIKVKIRI